MGGYMAEFANPFDGFIGDRKLSKVELIQALRLDLASELEAMFLYEAHAAATEDEVVRTQLRSIRDEEKTHAGELLALLEYLDPGVSDLLGDGFAEVKETLKKLRGQAGDIGSDLENEE